MNNEELRERQIEAQRMDREAFRMAPVAAGTASRKERSIAKLIEEGPDFELSMECAMDIGLQYSQLRVMLDQLNAFDLDSGDEKLGNAARLIANHMNELAEERREYLRAAQRALATPDPTLTRRDGDAPKRPGSARGVVEAGMNPTGERAVDDIAQDETRRGEHPPQERALERVETIMRAHYDPQDQLVSLVDMLSDIRHAVREYNRKNHRMVSFFNLCDVAYEAEI